MLDVTLGDKNDSIKARLFGNDNAEKLFGMPLAEMIAQYGEQFKDDISVYDSVKEPELYLSMLSKMADINEE